MKVNPVYRGGGVQHVQSWHERTDVRLKPYYPAGSLGRACEDLLDDLSRIADEVSKLPEFKALGRFLASLYVD